MPSSKSQRIAEIFGLIGVIGSLVFVGLEIRQSAVATQAASDAWVAEAFMEFNLVMASSPDLAKTLAEHGGNPEDAPVEAQIVILGLYRAMFHIWSNAHRQQMNGTIDPAVYESVVQELKANSGETPSGVDMVDITRRQKLTRWAWQRERYLYNPDFQRFVDQALGTSPQVSKP